MQLGGEFDQESRLHRAVEDQAGIALDLGDIVAVVVDAVAVEGQRRIAEQQHLIGHVAFAMFCGGGGDGGLAGAAGRAVDMSR